MSVVKVGDKFGSLLVNGLSFGERSTGGKTYLASVTCDCGSTLTVEKYNLTSGNTARCSECAKASRGRKKSTHGNSMSFKDRNPRGYNCYTRWQAMKRRCNNPSDKRFSDYGGRGIKVCDRWLESYENFLTDMGLPPEISYQIDRVDNSLGYSKENCKWVTRIENSRNKRNNRLIEVDGEIKTLSEWAELSGVGREAISARINRGISPKKAMDSSANFSQYIYQTPHGEFDSLSKAAKSVKMSISGINGRFINPNYKEWVKYERT